MSDEAAARWLSMNGATQPDGVRWTAADLDRCPHGRHSTDFCHGCDGIVGNTLLLNSGLPQRTIDGRTEVHIGFEHGGREIWVVAVRP
jgi:hypothetical protein